VIILNQLLQDLKSSSIRFTFFFFFVVVYRGCLWDVGGFLKHQRWYLCWKGCSWLVGGLISSQCCQNGWIIAIRIFSNHSRRTWSHVLIVVRYYFFPGVSKINVCYISVLFCVFGKICEQKLVEKSGESSGGTGA
jgi:hypothetical protein